MRKRWIEDGGMKVEIVSSSVSTSVRVKMKSRLPQVSGDGKTSD